MMNISLRLYLLFYRDTKSKSAKERETRNVMVMLVMVTPYYHIMTILLSLLNVMKNKLKDIKIKKWHEIVFN